MRIPASFLVDGRSRGQFRIDKRIGIAPGIFVTGMAASANLSKLSVWWLRLGIAIERIKPGHPQQNGRHERMHLTLKKEATRPPGVNSLLCEWPPLRSGPLLGLEQTSPSRRAGVSF